MTIIESTQIQEYEIGIDKSDKTFPFCIIVSKNGKEHGRTLQIKTFNEAKEAQKTVTKDIMEKEINEETYIESHANYLKARGFDVKINKANESTDDVITAKKENVVINLKKHELDGSKGIAMHFDSIKEVVDDLISSKDVFYSTISNMLHYKVKKSKYNMVMFSAVCDTLREQGIWVHS